MLLAHECGLDEGVAEIYDGGIHMITHGRKKKMRPFRDLVCRGSPTIGGSLRNESKEIPKLLMCNTHESMSTGIAIMCREDVCFRIYSAGSQAKGAVVHSTVRHSMICPELAQLRMVYGMTGDSLGRPIVTSLPAF